MLYRFIERAKWALPVVMVSIFFMANTNCYNIFQAHVEHLYMSFTIGFKYFCDQLRYRPVVTELKQPFPGWLTEITGLREWPTEDPPYVSLDFFNFDIIPKDIQIHEKDNCQFSENTCSYDCDHCFAFDDIFSCPQLSQTFDDGPTLATPKLLESLNTKSTFFTLGINIVQYPDIYRSATMKGHVMASHTWSHKFLPELTNEEVIAQIQWSIWAMNATGGHIPRWFRPPYGGLDDRIRSIVRQFGMQSVLWVHDSLDWKLETDNVTEKDIYMASKKWIESGKGGLILEHDFSGKTVVVGIEINQLVGINQMTVPECANGSDYIKVYT